MLTSQRLKEIYDYMTSPAPGINVYISPAEANQHHETYPHDMEKTLNFLKPYKRKGMRVLDIGSGFGFPVAAFAADGYIAHGVEHKKELVQHSRAKLEIMHRDGKIKTLPQIINAEFFSREFQNFIPTYDAFYAYHYGEAHARRVVLALKDAHSGALFMVEQRYFTPEILNIAGFSPINPSNPESYIIKK